MSQDNIFREVDEELRSDRIRSLWRRFMPVVIGAAVLVVAAVAVNEGWTWYHSNNAAQSSDELYAAFEAIDGGDLAAAQAQLDTLIANGSGSYPMLARFRKAGVLAQEGKPAEAVALYDTLANDLSDTRLRELALVLGGTILVDSGSLADVQGRLETVASEGGLLRNAARESLGLALYKAGQYSAAQQNFEAVLNDPLTQSQTRNRVGFYIGQMLSEGVIEPQPAETDAEQAADTIDEIVSDETPAVAPTEPAPSASAP
jgi:hypothetical protein